jgi:hypothetical protein
LQRQFNSFGHLQLPAPEFVSWVGASKQSSRAEELIERRKTVG